MNIYKLYDTDTMLLLLPKKLEIINRDDIREYDCYYILIINNDIAAIAVCGELSNDGIEVWKLEVLPDYRGQKLSEVLLSRILQDYTWMAISCINELSLKATLKVAETHSHHIELLVKKECSHILSERTVSSTIHYCVREE